MPKIPIINNILINHFKYNPKLNPKLNPYLNPYPNPNTSMSTTIYNIITYPCTCHFLLDKNDLLGIYHQQSHEQNVLDSKSD